MNADKNPPEIATTGDVIIPTGQKHPNDDCRSIDLILEGGNVYDRRANQGHDFFAQYRTQPTIATSTSTAQPECAPASTSTSSSTSGENAGQKGFSTMNANVTTNATSIDDSNPNLDGLQIACLGGAHVVTNKQVASQYVAAFPDPRERYQLSLYASLITEGSTIPFVTWRGVNPVTTCLIEDMGGYGFLVSYLWTATRDRCKGIGFAHMKSVLEQLATRKPDAVVFIEVEDPELPGLSEAERTMRTRRLNWYLRMFQAQRWSGKYTMPSLRDDSEPGVEGILLAVADRDVPFDEFLETAIHILTASYEVAKDHVYVAQLEAMRL